MNSLEKKMYAERQRSRMLCAAMLILILLLLLLSVYARLGPMLRRLDLLDSAQDLESYCAGSRGAARLKYDSAEEIGSFVMTETDFYSLSLQSGGAYLEAPFGGSSKDVQYHVWLLAGGDFQVLYCTPEVFAGKGTVPVIYDANGSNARIAEAFGFADGGAYVLFHTRASTSWTPCLLLALAALPFIGYLLWAKRSKRYLMRSPLGREIAKRGDFDSVARAFDEENYRFRCDTFNGTTTGFCSSTSAETPWRALTRGFCSPPTPWKSWSLSATTRRKTSTSYPSSSKPTASPSKFTSAALKPRRCPSSSKNPILPAEDRVFLSICI